MSILYRLNGKLQESNGQSQYDLINPGNIPPFSTTYTPPSGTTGGLYSVGGDDGFLGYDVIQGPSALVSEINGKQLLTIQAWVYKLNFFPASKIIGFGGAANSFIWDSNATLQATLNPTANLKMSPAIAPISNGAWHHIAFTYSSTGTKTLVKTYADGVLVGSLQDNVVAPVNCSIFWIGNGNAGGNVPLKAHIRDVQISFDLRTSFPSYDYVASGLSIYNIRATNVGLDQATIEWNLTSGNNFTDSVSYGIDPPGVLDQTTPTESSNLLAKSILVTGLTQSSNYLATPITISYDDVYYSGASQISFTTASPPPPPMVGTPLGAIASQDNGTKGTQAIGIGTIQSNPNYISADSFMDGILR